MKHFESFSYTGYSFAERTGEPDEICSAIGRIVYWFAALEDSVTLGVTKLASVDTSCGQILCAELSFRQKLHVFGSLVRHLLPTHRFNVSDAEPAGVLDELLAICFKCEELRNQILHSSWVGSWVLDRRLGRQKVTAKATRGLHTAVEVTDSGRLLDVADYICYVSGAVDEFFLVFEAR